MQKKLSPEEAQNLVLALWNRGSAILISHFKRRMRERKATMNDIKHLLETGRAQKSIEFDEDHKNWEYTIKGKDLDGYGLAVAFSFDEVFGDVFLITVKDA